MKKLFLPTIQEVENFKKLLGNPSSLTFRYLKMKRQYLVLYPSCLEEDVVGLGF